MKITMLSTLGMLAFASVASASDDSAVFEKVKGLAGTWNGNGTTSSDKIAVTVKYRVVAGGSAVEETIAPGTPHEMITMYYLDGKSLVLVHYCAMGNQPHMKLSLGTGTDAKFAFDGGANCPAGGVYMGGAEFKFLGSDHIQTQWTVTSAGKAVEHMNFDLQRAGGSPGAK